MTYDGHCTTALWSFTKILKYLQECGAVAASLSLSSLFPHSPQDQCHHLPVSPGPESPASHNTNLATIMEDENNVGSSIGNKENSGYSEENNGKW